MLASRLNSWARKSSRRPAGSLAVEQLARRGDVRGQALQLLLDVGARRQQRRLLVEARLVEGDAGLQQPADLLLQPLADGCGRARRASARRRPPGARSRRAARSTMVSQAAALVGARAHHAVERRHRGSPASPRRAPRLGLALLRLHQLQHAAHVEQRLGARRRHRRQSPCSRSTAASTCFSAVSLRRISVCPCARLTLRLTVRLPRRDALGRRPRGCAAPGPRSRAARAAGCRGRAR